MDNVNVSWSYWLGKASGYIKFKPDRAAVKEELLAHLEDKTEELLQDKTMLVREAEKQALAAMGDADEVGRQLAAVHKPWLGYLWLWSRRLVMLCVVVMVWMALGFSDRVYFSDGPVRYWQEYPGYIQDQYHQFTELSPVCADKSDGYTFTVPAAMLWHNDTYTTEDGYEIRESDGLYVTVRAARILPMTQSCGAFHDFYAVDDLGNVYLSTNSGYYGNGKSFVGNYGLTSPWACVYEAWVSELAPEAQWIELRYDRDGRDVRLRIDLTGGEAQ